MNFAWPKGISNSRSRSSNIQIYHNGQFPLQEIVAVLYPLFGPYYSRDDFMRMITESNHIFCAYDRVQRRCVACALVNEVGNKGGLYLMLFGVRQSNQKAGVGTRLLKSVVYWAYRSGHTFMYLHVHVDNYKAIGLYEKVGFRQHEYLPDYYSRTPKENPHAYRMAITFQ